MQSRVEGVEGLPRVCIILVPWWLNPPTQSWGEGFLGILRVCTIWVPGGCICQSQQALRQAQVVVVLLLVLAVVVQHGQQQVVVAPV